MAAAFAVGGADCADVAVGVVFVSGVGKLPYCALYLGDGMRAYAAGAAGAVAVAVGAYFSLGEHVAYGVVAPVVAAGDPFCYNGFAGCIQGDVE